VETQYFFQRVSPAALLLGQARNKGPFSMLRDRSRV
jgi:hypothetical protein